ncbi:MAG: hypothetical protein RIT14_1012 [Pseudomonadota bacterium]|jgi:drug/metabolite transporter (DMT)-like permease
MEALSLGLFAALLWGLHDFTVRRIGAQVAASAMLACVMALGVVPLLPLSLVMGNWHAFTTSDAGLAVLSGLAFATAGFGLYRAFAIGPVYLVAPICGAFPMLSVGFEALRGGTPHPLAWLGAATVVGGIGLVARSSENASDGRRLHAILWAALACLGFAISFTLAQWASESGAHLATALVARLAASLAALALVLRARPAFGPARAQWRPLLLMGMLDVGALTAVTLAGGLPNAEYASVASSIFGVVTILLAWRFLAEAMRPVQWAGVALVFGGILILGTT